MRSPDQAHIEFVDVDMVFRDRPVLQGFSCRFPRGRISVILGGFGGAVAEVLVENFPVPMERIGIRDEYSESAPNEDLAKKHQLTAPYVVKAAKRAVDRKHGRTLT